MLNLTRTALTTYYMHACSCIYSEAGGVTTNKSISQLLFQANKPHGPVTKKKAYTYRAVENSSHPSTPAKKLVLRNRNRPRGSSSVELSIVIKIVLHCYKTVFLGLIKF